MTEQPYTELPLTGRDDVPGDPPAVLAGATVVPLPRTGVVVLRGVRLDEAKTSAIRNWLYQIKRQGFEWHVIAIDEVTAVEGFDMAMMRRAGWRRA